MGNYAIHAQTALGATVGRRLSLFRSGPREHVLFV
jgi:hypothetical protein